MSYWKDDDEDEKYKLSEEDKTIRAVEIIIFFTLGAFLFWMVYQLFGSSFGPVLIK